MPGDLFLPVAGYSGSSAALIMGALLMLIVAGCMAFLQKGEVRPVPQIVVKELGLRHGFIYHWFVALTYLSIMALNVNTFTLLGRQLFADLFSVLPMYSVQGWVVHFGDILLIYGVLLAVFLLDRFQQGGLFKLQNLNALLLVGVVVYLGVESFSAVPVSAVVPEVSAGSRSGFLAVLVVAPWAFLGFEIIPQVAKSMGVKKTNVFLLMFIAIASGLGIYLIMNRVTAVGAGSLMGESQLLWATGYAVKQLSGNLGLVVLYVAMAAALMAGVNGFYIALKQLLKDGVGYFSESSVSDQAIKIGIFVIVGLTPWLGRPVLLWIVDMASLGACVSFAYSGWCCYRKVRQLPAKVISIGTMVIALSLAGLMLVPGSPAGLSFESITMLSGLGGLWVVLYSLCG